MQNDCFPDAVAEWPKASLGSLANVNPRYPVKKGRDYPFIEMAAVGENFRGILSMDRRMLEGSGLSRFRVGDTLFAKITPCAENGKVAFVSHLPDDIGLGSTEFIVLSPRPGTDARFLYHLACSHAVRGRAAARMEGSTGRQRVPEEVFTKRLLVPIPESTEQTAIARILDAVDTAMERTRAAVDAAASLRDALIQALLDRGIGEDGRVRCSKSAPEGFVATQIGLLPREWSVEPLSSVADIERGRFSPRPRNDPRYYKGPYPFIQTGQVAQAKGRVITTFTQTLNSAGKSVSREFPTGTVMVTIAANIGETSILGLPMCAPDSLVGVMAKGANVPRYIELCLRRLRRKLLALAPRSAQANINLTFLKPLRIPVPSPSEQERIARVVDAADARVQAIEVRVEALRTLRVSLLHDLLSGQVRVTNEIKAAAS